MTTGRPKLNDPAPTVRRQVPPRGAVRSGGHRVPEGVPLDAVAAFIRRAFAELGEAPKAGDRAADYQLRHARAQHYLIKAEIAATAASHGVPLPMGRLSGSDI